MIYESLMRNSKEEEEKLTIFSCMSWDGKPRFFLECRSVESLIACWAAFLPFSSLPNNVIITQKSWFGYKSMQA